jgi:hypothetical protein
MAPAPPSPRWCNNGPLENELRSFAALGGLRRNYFWSRQDRRDDRASLVNFGGFAEGHAVRLRTSPDHHRADQQDQRR